MPRKKNSRTQWIPKGTRNLKKIYKDIFDSSWIFASFCAISIVIMWLLKGKWKWEIKFNAAGNDPSEKETLTRNCIIKKYYWIAQYKKELVLCFFILCFNWRFKGTQFIVTIRFLIHSFRNRKKNNKKFECNSSRTGNK